MQIPLTRLPLARRDNAGDQPSQTARPDLDSLKARLAKLKKRA
jgi:hypothetical protein